GASGLIAMVKESFATDLEKFYDNIFFRYENRRVSQDDDITFVLIRRTQI
ncbi:MAG: hypothetical protein ACD_39C00609G0001, partial [uncultured bacterium]